MKRPSFQFYPGDYMKDPAIRATSMAGQGMWVNCLCIMHESPLYGYLTLDGQSSISMVILSRMVGITLHEAEGYMDELWRNGVYAKNDGGIIYSKRMVRDERVRNLRAEGGKYGGNPLLKGTKKVIPKVQHTDNLKPTPSSSSSSSPSGISNMDETKKVNHKFVKPTVPELEVLMAKAGLPLSEAQRFFNYYESNGWKVGRNPMKSPPHAVANWASNYRQHGPVIGFVQGGQPQQKSLMQKLVEEI